MLLIKRNDEEIAGLTPWSKVLLDKLIFAQLVKNFPPFIETGSLIHKSCHWRLSWANWI